VSSSCLRLQHMDARPPRRLSVTMQGQTRVRQGRKRKAVCHLQARAELGTQYYSHHPSSHSTNAIAQASSTVPPYRTFHASRLCRTTQSLARIPPHASETRPSPPPSCSATATSLPRDLAAPRSSTTRGEPV